jgi:hypothetical protein
MHFLADHGVIDGGRSLWDARQLDDLSRCRSCLSMQRKEPDAVAHP